MLHWRFIGRQITASRQQAMIFIACVALSLLTLVSLSGLANSVRHSMLQDARELHAADIIIHSHYPITTGLSQEIDRLKAAKRIASARIYEFYSMVRYEKMAKTLLCQLKIVEPGYPFYGTVELSSGSRFSEKLTSGSIIVEQEVLDRLKAKIGDTLEIGSASFTIADVVTREPDRPVSFFSFGPRVFIAAADMDRLNLLKQGSRIHFNVLVKVFDPKEIDGIASQLKKAAVEGQERVETYRTAGSGVKRFFENFLFFLNLIGIFTLLLAGIGIQTALTALIRSNYSTIAIMKSLGATSRFITLHFLAIIMLLGVAGTMVGLAACFLLQQFLPIIFAGILPTDVTMIISWSEISEGLLLGTMVAGLFSVLPLRVVKALRPAGIFRKETSTAVRGHAYYTVIAIIAIFFVLLTIWQLEDVKTGLYFVFAVACLIGFTALCSAIFLSWIRRKKLRRLALRQAARSLHRPGNATLSVIVSLCAALAVIFSISLIERNLYATFVASYPKDLPNVYFIDIQPHQVESFKDLLGQRVQLYPIVRARIASINGKPIDRIRERHKRSDNLAREFNLTYRHNLLEDERMLQGPSLFGKKQENHLGKDEVPVSILDTLADMADIGIGDHIEFNIQGFPLKARVVSIRTRTESLARPFFYFVFQEKALEDAPHTFFAALRVDREQLPSIQNRVAAELPNISVIDIGQTVKVLAAIMKKLTGVIQFFTLFSVIAGLLIIVSSLLATQFARIREAVYFRILGARSSFIVSVFSWENIFVALLSSLQATFISQVGGWIICRQLLDIPYRPFIELTVLMIFFTTLLVLMVGFSASLPILRKKPVVFLRDEMEE
jgi:putative ABC transport system permease protein